jgi:2-polyprenyl-6-methoxyphenol hydroxylase-like FAD-dependent oxidoreductase
MPRGFLVIGDAATRVNPTYATGMSTAALSALELHRLAAARGVLDRRFARKAQGRIIEVAVGAWQMALGYDHWFPGVRANVKRRGGKRILRFSNRYMRASADLPAVANATYHVAALLAPASRLMRLPLLLSVLRGPRRPPLTADQAIAQYPSLLKALDVLDAEDRA